MLNRETLVRNAYEIEDLDVRARVVRGIHVLCDYDPEWAENVDPSELVMADPNECVLGQVFANHFPATGQGRDVTAPSYYVGLRALGHDVPDVSRRPQRYAFDVDYDDLDAVTAAWLMVLGYEDDERVDPLSVGR